MLPELMKWSASQTVRNTYVQQDGKRLNPCDCASQTPSQAHREKNGVFLRQPFKAVPLACLPHIAADEESVVTTLQSMITELPSKILVKMCCR